MYNQKLILLTALLSIKANGPKDPVEGICMNVEILTMNVEGSDDMAMTIIMRDIFERWEEFSGEWMFPVPCEGGEPATAYYATDILWEGEYGEARKRLLDFLILELQGDTECRMTK